MMTYKEFSDWCNQRACDGCWGMNEATICINIIRQVQSQPVWKRERTWQELNSKYSIENKIIDPIDNKITEAYIINSINVKGNQSSKDTYQSYTTVGDTSSNIIFLDIDGVLNGYNKWSLLGWRIVSLTKNKRLQNWYRKWTDPCGIHESKVKRLAKIVNETNAKVVMSSSWRFGWWNTPYEEQYEDQKKLTGLLKKYNIEVIDITPKSSDGRRDKEIIYWLSKHEDIVRRFVILDDERYDLECFANSNLVQTSSVSKGQMIMGHAREDTGLKNKHVKKAIEILRK
jgi:hypothetical protein